jgi:hypothetical protein
MIPPEKYGRAMDDTFSKVADGTYVTFNQVGFLVLYSLYLQGDDENESLDGGDVGEDPVDGAQQADEATIDHHTCTHHQLRQEFL